MNKKKNQKRKFLDHFFESDSEDEEEDDFFESDDDFENEFDDMIIKSHFGFSNFGKMHRRLFDRFNQIGDGREEGNEEEEEEEEEKDERRIRKKRANHFGGFMNFKGDSSGTVISKSYCTKIDYIGSVEVQYININRRLELLLRGDLHIIFWCVCLLIVFMCYHIACAVVKKRQ